MGMIVGPRGQGLNIMKLVNKLFTQTSDNKKFYLLVLQACYIRVSKVLQLMQLLLWKMLPILIQFIQYNPMK